MNHQSHYALGVVLRDELSAIGVVLGDDVVLDGALMQAISATINGDNTPRMRAQK